MLNNNARDIFKQCYNNANVCTIVSTIVKNNGRDNANNGTNVAAFLKELFQTPYPRVNGGGGRLEMSLALLLNNIHCCQLVL